MMLALASALQTQYGSAKNQIKINVMSGLPPGTVPLKVRDWCAF